MNTEPTIDRITNLLRGALANAIVAEREACALLLMEAAKRYPNDPQIRGILRAQAESIRARPQP